MPWLEAIAYPRRYQRMVIANEHPLVFQPPRREAGTLLQHNRHSTVDSVVHPAIITTRHGSVCSRGRQGREAALHLGYLAATLGIERWEGQLHPLVQILIRLHLCQPQRAPACGRPWAWAGQGGRPMACCPLMVPTVAFGLPRNRPVVRGLHTCTEGTPAAAPAPACAHLLACACQTGAQGRSCSTCACTASSLGRGKVSGTGRTAGRRPALRHSARRGAAVWMP